MVVVEDYPFTKHDLFLLATLERRMNYKPATGYSQDRWTAEEVRMLRSLMDRIKPLVKPEPTKAPHEQEAQQRSA